LARNCDKPYGHRFGETQGDVKQVLKQWNKGKKSAAQELEDSNIKPSSISSSPSASSKEESE
jgi:hypothetical protein